MRMFDTTKAPYKFVFEIIPPHVDKSVIDVTFPWNGDTKNMVTDRISLPIQLRVADVGRLVGVTPSGEIDFEDDDQMDVRLAKGAILQGRTYVEIKESNVNFSYVNLEQSDLSLHTCTISHLLEHGPHEPPVITQADVGRRVFYNRTGPLRAVVELVSVFQKRKAEAPAKGPSYVEVLPARLRCICEESTTLRQSNAALRNTIAVHQQTIAKNEDRLRVLSGQALAFLFK